MGTALLTIIIPSPPFIHEKQSIPTGLTAVGGDSVIVIRVVKWRTKDLYKVNTRGLWNEGMSKQILLLTLIFIITWPLCT